MNDPIITQLTRERSELIERLSAANAILASVKGILEADKLFAETQPLHHYFTDLQQRTLDRVNAHLAGGLFGTKTNGDAK